MSVDDILNAILGVLQSLLYDEHRILEITVLVLLCVSLFETLLYVWPKKTDAESVQIPERSEPTIARTYHDTVAQRCANTVRLYESRVDSKITQAEYAYAMYILTALGRAEVRCVS